MKLPSAWLFAGGLVFAVGTSPAAAAQVQSQDSQDKSAEQDWSSESQSTQSQDTQEAVVPKEEPMTLDTNVDVSVDEQKEEHEGVLESLVPSPDLRLTGPDALKNVIVELGGGASTFTGDLGNSLEGGASWTARAVIGARSLLGGEVEYFGAWNSLENVDNEFTLDPFDGEGLAVDKSVYTTSFSGMARINLLDEKAAVRPFAAAGLGYLRFDSDLVTFNDEDALAVPLAAGVQVYPYENVTVGARAEYKILEGIFSNDFFDGDQWGGTLTVGANF